MDDKKIIFHVIKPCLEHFNFRTLMKNCVHQTMFSMIKIVRVLDLSACENTWTKFISHIKTIQGMRGAENMS